MTESVGINAIFVLACGCTMDGCHDSDPGRKWAAGVRNGALYCTEHRSWQTVIDVVSLDPVEALRQRTREGEKAATR